MSIAKDVEAVVKPVIEGMGMELVETEYVKEGSKWFLRLYIDKDQGITLDDCENVSNSVNELLDGIGSLNSAYTFEVSSPGFDRPLKSDRDYVRYAKESVEVLLYAQRDGSKSVTGTLIGRKDGKVSIVNDNGDTVAFDVKEIAAVKRVIDWNNI